MSKARGGQSRILPGLCQTTRPQPLRPQPPRCGAAGARPAPGRGTPATAGPTGTKSSKLPLGTSDLTTTPVAFLMPLSAGSPPSLPAHSLSSDLVLDSCASTIITGPLQCLGGVPRATPVSPVQDLSTKTLSPVLPQCQIAVPRATSVCPVQAPEHGRVTTLERDAGLPRPGYSHEQLAALHPPAPLPGLSVASRRGAVRPVPPPSRPAGAAIST